MKGWVVAAAVATAAALTSPFLLAAVLPALESVGNTSGCATPAAITASAISAPPLPGARYTGAKLAADALLKAGFPANEAPTMTAAAYYESGFRPAAVNHQPSGDYFGFWQISYLHTDLLRKGDWRDPYANAVMAKALRDREVAAHRDPLGPWTTAGAAKRAAGKYVQLVASLAGTAPAPVPVDCASGDINGGLRLVAVLNPAESGNWQNAVKSGSYWYVYETRDAQRGGRVHRLDASGRELDSMTVNGAQHSGSFVVLGSQVYLTFGNCHSSAVGCAARDRTAKVRTFAYRPNVTISASQATPTAWTGQISVDPTASSRLIQRWGNRYTVYDTASHRRLGGFTTPAGGRQGFSIQGSIGYVLTGFTNGPARVDSYNWRTGQQTGTRDITSLGAAEAGNHREPEGAFGAMVGIKTNNGDRRRLRIYTLTGAAPIAPTTTAQGKARVAISYALGQVGKRYVWATHGPATFDCSGLTSAAWRAAGVNITPQSDAQFRDLPHVPISQARPGDIAFHPGHVQLIVSTSPWVVVEAANPRAGVRVDRSHWMKPTAILRP